MRIITPTIFQKSAVIARSSAHLREAFKTCSYFLFVSTAMHYYLIAKLLITVMKIINTRSYKKEFFKKEFFIPFKYKVFSKDNSIPSNKRNVIYGVAHK